MSRIGSSSDTENSKKTSSVRFSVLSICIVFLLCIAKGLQAYKYGDYNEDYVFVDILGSVSGVVLFWVLIPTIIATVNFFVKNGFSKPLFYGLFQALVLRAFVHFYSSFCLHFIWCTSSV